MTLAQNAADRLVPRLRPSERARPRLAALAERYRGETSVPDWRAARLQRTRRPGQRYDGDRRAALTLGTGQRGVGREFFIPARGADGGLGVYGNGSCGSA
jgi:hypothetical protein